MVQSATIVIPAYNEEENIGAVLREVISVGVGKKIASIIVVDDGSTDNTGNIARQAGVRVLTHPYNKGYGAALKTGIRAADTDVVIILDSDGQHNPSDIDKLLPYIETYDMVVGSRLKSTRGAAYRGVGRWILTKVANYLSGAKIPDLNSGFRVIRRDKILEFMPILPNSFSLSTTITLAMLKSGCDVKYVPVKSEARKGTSKIKPLRDGLNFALLIIRTIMLFDPLKVFLPISLALGLLGIPYVVYEAVRYTDVSTGPVMIVLAAILVFLFGLIADQISSLRRTR